MAEKFSLKWNDFTSNVSTSFGRFRTADYLHDVTIVSDDHKQISAHKLVLSACSEYFRNIFQNNSKHAHPLLCLEGVSSTDLENMLDYIYNGEIQIYQDNLDRFLSVAQRFRLEGLLSDKNESDHNMSEDTESRYIESEIINDKDKGIHLKRKMAKNNCPPVTSSRDVGKIENVVVPISAEEMKDLETKISQYLERCEDGKFRCTLCGKTATQKIEIKDHVEGVHLEGISVPCPQCDKTFRSRVNLRKHKSRVHK